MTVKGFEDRGLPPVGMGPAIRAARERAGLGLRAAAREIGISPTHLTNLEAGLRRPSAAAAERIAGVLPLTEGERARLDSAVVVDRGLSHPARVRKGGGGPREVLPMGSVNLR